METIICNKCGASLRANAHGVSWHDCKPKQSTPPAEPRKNSLDNIMVKK